MVVFGRRWGDPRHGEFLLCLWILDGKGRSSEQLRFKFEMCWIDIDGSLHDFNQERELV